MNDVPTIADFPINDLIGSYSSLILFGSYSRGDFRPDSDIDLLQVSNIDVRTYTIGKFNISVYSVDQLNKMAKEGNLFVLHLLMEGTVLAGCELVLDDLKKIYKRKSNYNHYRSEIIATAKILDIHTDSDYMQNWKGYNNLLGFLFRSYLYSSLYDQGSIIFSIEKIAEHFNDRRISTFFAWKKDQTFDFSKFKEGVALFEVYSKSKFINEYGTLNNLFGNLDDQPRFLKSIGKHFLQGLIEDVAY